jgi:hypothetical protein
MELTDFIGGRAEAIAFARLVRFCRTDPHLPYFWPHYLREKCETFDFCQGTRTFTRLGDTNLYEPGRSPRNIRGHFSCFPDLPCFRSRPVLLAAACVLPSSPFPGLVLPIPPRYSAAAG